MNSDILIQKKKTRHNYLDGPNSEDDRGGGSPCLFAPSLVIPAFSLCYSRFLSCHSRFFSLSFPRRRESSPIRHCEERVFFLFRPFDRVSVANEWRNLSEIQKRGLSTSYHQNGTSVETTGRGGVIARLYSAVAIQPDLSFGE